MNLHSAKILYITADSAPIPDQLKESRLDLCHLAIQSEANSIRINTNNYAANGAALDSDEYVFGQSVHLVRAVVIDLLLKAHSNFVIFVNYSDELMDIIEDILVFSDIPFVLIVDDSDPVPWTKQFRLSSAADRVTLRPGSYEAYQRSTVYPANDLSHMTDRQFRAYVDQITAYAARLNPTDEAPRGKKKSRKHRTLIISYYAEPATTVAVHRVGYWLKQMGTIGAEIGFDIEAELVSAIGTPDALQPGHFIVPDKGPHGSEGSPEEALKNELMATRVNYFSVYWAKHLRDFFEEHKHRKYDSIILTGNPFYYFSIADYFKQRDGSKIILDFRDPFAHNPRFKYTPEHKKLVCRLEEEYTASADLIISVNDYCLNRIEAGADTPKQVISNGFDQDVIDGVTPKPIGGKRDRIDFIYTGSFFADRKPDIFLSQLDQQKHRLVHIGRAAKTDEHLDQYPTIERLGLMAYSDVLAHCKTADVGVIFTGGEAFEQTTKIFDYIAADLPILIVTDGKPNTGNLESLTGELEEVYWVRNKESEIKKFLTSFAPNRVKRPLSKKYSRGEQTKKLLQSMMEL